MTEPWDADTPTLLTNTLGHITRAWVQPGTDPAIDLDVLDGTLSYDEARTPRVTAELTCAIPARDAVAALDPRLAGRRLVIQVGYRRPDGTEDVHTVADLQLRGRALRYPDNTMRVTAASDEAKLLDDSPSAGATVISETGAAGAVSAIIEAAGLGYILDDSTPADATVYTVDPLRDKWDAIEDVLDQAGVDFYGTGEGEGFYALAPRPALSSTPAHTVTTGNGGVITDGTYRVDRDDWHNRVFLEHEWRDSAGVDKRVAVVGNAAGTFAPTTGNVRTLHVRRNTPTTSTKAAGAAQTLANRQATRGRSLGLTAISAYWLRPGHTLAAQLPDIDTERHLVASVTFRLADGLMDISTRLPE